MTKQKISKQSKEKYIVTSALPYVNGIKHLGNLIGSLLPADVYARYLRLIDKDVVAVCGTDEHGTTSEVSALEEHMPVKEYCDKYYLIQKKIYEEFGLSFDYFGRTSAPENHQITQNIFMRLWENGYITPKEDSQLYCENDQRYLPDRYTLGTCPKCGYEYARGDQCENCTTLLDPKELINPVCRVCGKSNIVVKPTKHLYLNLPKLEPEIKEWIEKQTHWPTTTKAIAAAWIKEGLKERSITRNLTWGIQVPIEEYKELLFYCWFDAPIGYASITAEWANEQKKPDLWKNYWKDPSTKLVQFMGVDNVPFHTVTWPATLIGTRDGYTLPYMTKSFNWLTYDGGKFSTSQNRGVFTDQALKLYPADYWRYYLLLIAPERQATDFSWEGFQQAVNHNLANQLGNFVHRTLTFINQHFNGIVPEIDQNDPGYINIVKEIQPIIQDYRSQMDVIELQKTAVTILGLWQVANKFFQSREPWRTVKEDKVRTATTVSVSAHLCYIIAVLSAPFIPFTAEKIFSYLGFEDSKAVHEVKWDQVVNFSLLIGRKIESNPVPLFTAISDKEIAKLKQQYAGKIEEIPKVKTSSPKSDGKFKPNKPKVDTKDGRISIEDFDKVDIRIGKVLTAKKVENSDSLLQLEIDIGDEKRQILSGIAKQYQPDDLIGKFIPVLINLQPKKFKGLESQGMILIAETSDNKYVLLSPVEELPTGSKVH